MNRPGKSKEVITSRRSHRLVNNIKKETSWDFNLIRCARRINPKTKKTIEMLISTVAVTRMPSFVEELTGETAMLKMH